ncbi:hypothetical protein P879_02562 [Paragonimus westermani]|uniref:Arrestin C-terminal-like domain-containing protein n=1 Tax=Paragonimus westermani TaxID=34504 RepID=A0A8T0DMG6_9TREM|nr:hypothetical protein P879_02562 [Paragonimus westermani]
MSSPKSSPKNSLKNFPKKGGRSSPGKEKLSAEEIEEMDRTYFARKRYDTMDAVFTQKSPAISIYARSIHLYEIWNKIPPYGQFCNSNQIDMNESNKNSPKSAKSSPKKSPKKGVAANVKGDEDEPVKPDYEPAVLTGVISVQKSHLVSDKKVFVEVTAKFQYVGHAKVPPFPDNVTSKCQCFRDVSQIYPVNFDLDTPLSDFSQQLIYKLRQTLGRGYRMFPFSFDVTGKPDSLFFTRPYYPDYSSGLFWNLRAYIAHEENCSALSNEEINMEFFKYTITPVVNPLAIREIPMVSYTRFATQNDTGDLILQAKLEREVYYHGQEIKVKIHIENNSSRHVIDTIAVFVEQTYRLFHQFPHDSSIPLGEVLLRASEHGLPIQPRSRGWTKEVLVKPVYDPTKYNLAVDGRMAVDNKIFLANSTVIMMTTQVTIPKPDESTDGKQSPTGSPKGKRSSPEDKSPQKGKKSPRDKSPGKGAKASPTPAEEPVQTGAKPIMTMKEVNILTNKQACRSVTVAYDVVVRLNLRSAHGEESGHPMVRLPFILTRETPFLDKLTNPSPPTWAVVQTH